MRPNSQVEGLTLFMNRDISPITKGDTAEYSNPFFFFFLFFYLTAIMIIVLGIENMI